MLVKKIKIKWQELIIADDNGNYVKEMKNQLQQRLGNSLQLGEVSGKLLLEIFFF